jgi:class 3 adenylate cyclase
MDVRCATPDGCRHGVRSDSRRQVTVLFCDLVGSTELSGAMELEDCHVVMGEYRRRVAAVVQAHRGRLHSTLGDGLTASSGYPRASVHTGIALVANGELGGQRERGTLVMRGFLKGAAAPRDTL